MRNASPDGSEAKIKTSTQAFADRLEPFRASQWIRPFVWASEKGLMRKMRPLFVSGKYEEGSERTILITNLQGNKSHREDHHTHDKVAIVLKKDTGFPSYNFMSLSHSHILRPLLGVDFSFGITFLSILETLWTDQITKPENEGFLFSFLTPLLKEKGVSSIIIMYLQFQRAPKIERKLWLQKKEAESKG